jgi:hypothetical protein
LQIEKGEKKEMNDEGDKDRRADMGERQKEEVR